MKPLQIKPYKEWKNIYEQKPGNENNQKKPQKGIHEQLIKKKEETNSIISSKLNVFIKTLRFA